MTRRSGWSGALVACLVWAVCVGGCSCDEVARRAAYGDRDGVGGAAVRATALAAVLLAAGQVAEGDEILRLRSFGIVPSFVDPVIEERFPVRGELERAVAMWPRERKLAALAWVRAHATWTSQLHALAIESFDARLEPTSWGPTMSRFSPPTFADRAALGELLRDALADEAVRRIAAAVAVQPESFTARGVAERREKLVAYLRTEDELPPFAAFFDPLLAPGHGVNAVLPDGTVLMAVGPSADAGTRSMVLFHEMAHPPVNRLLERPAVAAALDASRCAFDRIETRFGYDSWRSFFAEAFVRSLSYRLEGVPALDTGLVFEGYLAAELQRWEAQPHVPLEDAVVGMLHGIAVRDCAGMSER